LVIAILSADIPYFQYFYRHINLSILNWAEFGGDASMMILEEKSYWPYFLLFILSVTVFSYLIVTLSRKIAPYKLSDIKSKDLIIFIPVVMVCITICIVGMRGNIRQKETLQISHAFVSGERNTILDQLPINPVFFFFKSSSSTSENLMDLKKAIEVSEKELGFEIENNDYNSPLDIVRPENVQTPNIILIFSESLSDGYLHIKRNNISLTPFINELINKSYYFEKFYSQGIHTNQGITATLYGFPTILDFHMFKSYMLNEISSNGVSMGGVEANQKELTPQYNGLPADLRNYGYENLYFMTHMPGFDNSELFFKKNGFENIVSLENYPATEVVNMWGISDYDLFKHSLNKFDEMHNNDKHFFGTIQTISNHPPYYYTDEFESISDDKSEKAIAYTDSCIKYFIENASKKEWFGNTIFVILGDHGKAMTSNTGNSDLNLNHVPLIIYSPLFNDAPKRISNLAGQIDVYPTVMNIIGLPCSYKSFGIDVLNKKRGHIFFSSDDKITALNDKYRYTYDLSSKMSFLYENNTSNNINLIDKYPSIADSLREYSFAMTESAKYILKNITR